MGDILTTGLGIGSGLIEGAANTIFGGIQQRRTAEIQKKQNKEMMDYQQQKQLEMWAKTGYGPQVQQMKNAGINPALLYGMSGGGASTIGAAIPNTNVGSGEGHAPINQGIAMALQSKQQAELLQAQKENIEADTRNKQVEATKKEGVDTKEAETRIDLNVQELTNKKAQQYLTQSETAINELTKQFLEGTLEDRIKDVEYTVSRSLRLLQLADNEQKMAAETYEDRKRKIVNEGIKSSLENALIKTQTGKTAVETLAIQEQIRQGWTKIEQEATKIQQEWGKMSQEQRKIAIHNFEAQIKASYPTLWQIPGHIITGVEGMLNRAFGENTISK